MKNNLVFEKNHSISHAINYSVKYVADNIELRKHVIGIFLELSKAFDFKIMVLEEIAWN